MTAEQKILRKVAEIMTNGIRLRPKHLFGKMDDGKGGACAVGTLRAGQYLRGKRPLATRYSWDLSEALRPRFEARTIPCNDELHIPREAMVQVLCEDAGLADG